MSLLTHISFIALFGIVGKSMVDNLNFKDSLGFYASYHQEPHNQLIHFIFIPLIWWSINVWMCYVVAPGCGGLKLGGRSLTYGTIMLLLYSAYYVTLDPLTGSIFSTVLTLFYFQASGAVEAEKEEGKAVKGNKKGKKKKGGMSWGWFAFWVHLLGWVMQIGPGHGYFEGVKPALLDSLGQALGVAPFFAFLEGIWAAGIKGDLKIEVGDLVAVNRRIMCEGGGGYPWC